MGTESGLRRRVKGLSEAEFRAAVRHRGAMPGGAVPAALGQGLGLPGLRPRPLRRAQGPGGLPVQPLQAPGRADRRHGVPLDQAAADHLVSGDLPSEPEQGRDELGRAGAPARHAAADGVADEAQADGGDGSARGRRSPSSQGRVEVDDAYLGGAALGRQARPRCRRQDPVRRRGRDDGRAQAQAAAAHRRQGLPQEGDRDAGQARLRRRQQRRQRRPVLLDGGRASRLHHFPMVTGTGPQAAKWVPFTWVNTALGNIKTALAGTYHHVSAKHAQRYLASFAWRLYGASGVKL